MLIQTVAPATDSKGKGKSTEEAEPVEEEDEDDDEDDEDDPLIVTGKRRSRKEVDYSDVRVPLGHPHVNI